MPTATLTRHATKVGAFVVVFFFVCLLWRLFLVDPAVQEFHMLALKTALPGFQGYDILSILWGAILSFLYGFLAAQLCHRMHQDCCQGK